MSKIRKRILSVDDDEIFLALIRMKLESSGYQVESAASGKEAISCAQKQPFDLIILDLLMPKPNGFKVFQRLKDLSIASRTKILVLTVLGLEPQVQALMDAGAHHLMKDDAVQQLVPKVKELIGGP